MKTILTSILFSLFISTGFAQLKGSGNVVKRTFEFQQFNQLRFQDLDGRIDVAIGNSWSVEVSIDDNLEPLLQVTLNKNADELTVKLVKNENNRKYIENTNIRVKITLPNLTHVKHEGNSMLYITGINSSFINLSNGGNGSVVGSGVTDSLRISNAGNGNVNFAALSANNIMVTNRGNGNSIVFATVFLEGIVSGNGSIKNKGNALFSKGSRKSGNGRLIAVTPATQKTSDDTNH